MSLSYGGRRQCSPVAARNFHCFCLVAAAADTVIVEVLSLELTVNRETKNVIIAILLLFFLRLLVSGSVVSPFK